MIKIKTLIKENFVLAKTLKKGDVIRLHNNAWRVEYVDSDEIGLYGSRRTRAFKSDGFTKVYRKTISPNTKVELKISND